MYDENIESKVAKSILQQTEEITIGDEVMSVAPPSTATLILVSEETAKLPHVKLDSENIVLEALSVAKDCRVLGDIVAILILGAKNLQTTQVVEKKRLFGLITQRKEITINNKAELAKRLLEDIQPKELHRIVVRLLKGLQIADFFGFTTSLIEINLLRQTREVVKETTVSGQ